MELAVGERVSTLAAIEKTCTSLSRQVSTISVVGMLAVSIAICLDVALRFLVNAPIQGLTEVSQLAMAVIVAGTLPVGIMERTHISIDLLEDVLGKRYAKLGEAIGAVLLLLFMAILTWRFAVYSGRIAARGDTTMILSVLKAPFWWGVTALIAVCIPLQAVVVARTIADTMAAFAESRASYGRGVVAGALFAACLLGTVVLYYAMLRWGARMTPAELALIAFAAIWVPVVILVPVGVAMGYAGIVGAGVIVNFDASLNTLVIQVSSFLANINVMVLPLFLIMGSFAAVAGISEDVYDIAHAILGRARGGLAMASIGGCAGFGAVTGSSVATAATIGRVAIPEMKARGYDSALSTGTLAAGGTLGALVPPGSGPLVIFALLTEASIGQLFVASVIPAVLAVALYLATIWIYVRLRPNSAPPAAPAAPGALTSALRRSGPLLILFGSVMGGLYLGVFTATESAAVGAVAAFLIALFRGRLKRGAFLQVIAETTNTTAMVYGMIFGALMFSFFTGISGLAEGATAWITGLGWSPVAVVALLLVVYLLLGTFMESYTIMIITVPIVTPLILSMGYDILWWGILMLCVVETGAITPPFGLNMFVLKSIGEVPMSTVFKGVMPFVVADCIRIAILAIFPSLSTWLPSTMF